MTPLEGLSSAGLFGELRRAVKMFRQGFHFEAVERIRMIRRIAAIRRTATRY